MSDLTAAAAALGVPEALVLRSAAARATATGMTVDEVLTAWAGGGAVAGDTPPSVGEAPTGPPAEQGDNAPPTVGETPVAAPPSEPETVTTAPPPGLTTRAPAPAEVSAAEAANLPEVVTVLTAGIRERTNFVFPRWLAAVMLIIPLFALFALGGSATGICGEATELQTDVVSGEIVNCDGSEFTGSGVGGGGGTDYLALGERVYNGEGATCAGCHGAGGGGASGPSLAGVLTTFGVCFDHIEWVRLGTQGFQTEGRANYGDTNKPVGGAGIMPPHASLSADQIAAVVVFERVRFGGEDPDEALVDCGVAGEEPGAEGEEGAPPPEDGTVTTTTVAG